MHVHIKNSWKFGILIDLIANAYACTPANRRDSSPAEWNLFGQSPVDSRVQCVASWVASARSRRNTSSSVHSSTRLTRCLWMHWVPGRLETIHRASSRSSKTPSNCSLVELFAKCRSTRHHHHDGWLVHHHNPAIRPPAKNASLTIGGSMHTLRWW